MRRRRGRTVLAMPRDLNTRAAITVVEPLLRALRRHHVFAVGRPHGGHVVLSFAIGELTGVRPIRVGDPDILRSISVTYEHEMLAAW